MITDYSSLQQAVADWLARADLTAQIPTFVTLAEARMNRDLRVAAMQATVTGAAASGQIVLPQDCRWVQSLRIASGNTYRVAHPLTAERLADTLPSAVPIGYVVVGNTIKLIGGAGNETYAMTYMQAIPSLTSVNTANWLLTREPGIYLYATLMEASPYIVDKDRIAVWMKQYADILQGMKTEDDQIRYGNAPAMRMRRAMP